MNYERPSCHGQILALIEELEGKGQLTFSQAEIIDALTARGTRCSRSRIQKALHRMTAGKCVGETGSTEELKEVKERVYRRRDST